MIKLEMLCRGQQIRGIIRHQSVTLVDVERHEDAVTVIFKRPDGQPGTHQ